jgi:ribonuclease Z
LQQGGQVVLDDGRVVHGDDYLLPPRARRKIVIGGDNDTPALLAQELADAQVLVHEATYTEPVLHKVGPAPQHSSALRVARVAEQARVPNLVLTHFSPRYQKEHGPLSMADIEAEARSAYGGQLFLAEDFATYALARDGTLARESRQPRSGAMPSGQVALS